jgi:hypothetical protein
MSKNILYSFRRCPFAIRTRLSLILSNTSCEIREILLRDKPKEMLKISPKGTVPIFIKDSGEILDESMDIINWLIEEKNFLKKNTPSNLIEDLIVLFDNDFKHHLDRYNYSFFNYISSKFRITKNQTLDNTLILNGKCENSINFLKDIKIKSQLVYAESMVENQTA